MSDSNYLTRVLKRERSARSMSEALLEEQTRNLYLANEKLEEQNKLAAQHVKKIELFLSIIKMSHEHFTVEKQLQYFLKYVCEMSGWLLGHICIPDIKNNAIVNSSSIWYFKDKICTLFKKATEKTIFKAGIGLPGTVFENQQPEWVRDIRTDSNFLRREAALTDGLQSAFGIPIIVKKEVIAIAEFYFNFITEKDVYLLQIVEAAAEQLAFYIEKQKETEEHEKNIESINKQLISAARKAGMAEIASSTLHNVGNILNSVNVSGLLLQERLNAIQFKGLNDIVHLMNANAKDFYTFINENPQGKSLMAYLNKLPQAWQEHKDMLQKELDSLNENINHIKNIIATQQSLTGSSGLIEQVMLIDVIEEALKLNQSAFGALSVNIQKEYIVKPMITTDKVKLLQILVNLIRNAYETLQEANNLNKKINISVLEMSDAKIAISIEDNGKGIAEKDLTKIFSYGFTTKKNGHGIGLHTSALTAREMGGSLEVKSNGVEKGAIFTLTLPTRPRRRKEDHLKWKV